MMKQQLQYLESLGLLLPVSQNVEGSAFNSVSEDNLTMVPAQIDLDRGKHDVTPAYVGKIHRKHVF